MNLEKEIQLFEEWCDIFGLPIDEVDGEYTDPRTTIAFLAWYEVINREGCKIVPVEPSHKQLDALKNSCALFQNIGVSDIESYGAYKAMIGAVE